MNLTPFFQGARAIFSKGFLGIFWIIKRLPRLIPYIYVFGVILFAAMNAIEAKDASVFLTQVNGRIVLAVDAVYQYAIQLETTTGFWASSLVILGMVGAIFMVMWWLKAFKWLIGWLSGPTSSIPGIWILSIFMLVMLQLGGTSYLGLTEYEDCIAQNTVKELVIINGTEYSRFILTEECPLFDRVRLTPLKGFITLGQYLINSDAVETWQNNTAKPINDSKPRSKWITFADLFV